MAAKLQPDGDCLIWMGAVDVHGYGYIRDDDQSTQKAHRVAFRLANGRWPDVTHHTCARPLCCNPEHLLDVTRSAHLLEHHSENMNMGSHQALKTHCPAGHPYDDANTYRYRGRRHCRRCHADRTRRRNHPNE
jgi:hypothetical protein